MCWLRQLDRLLHFSSSAPLEVKEDGSERMVSKLSWFTASFTRPFYAQAEPAEGSPEAVLALLQVLGSCPAVAARLQHETETTTLIERLLREQAASPANFARSCTRCALLLPAMPCRLSFLSFVYSQTL